MTPDTPAHQPQQEYIITEKQLHRLTGDLITFEEAAPIEKAIRSRHHTSTPAPEDQLPEESEQWREAYQNGYTDGQAKAAIENERINAQVAKAAREKALDEVIAKLHNQMAANWTPHREGLEKAVILVESLRSQQEPQQ